jgi:hypothetical protein
MQYGLRLCRVHNMCYRTASTGACGATAVCYKARPTSSVKSWQQCESLKCVYQDVCAQNEQVHSNAQAAIRVRAVQYSADISMYFKCCFSVHEPGM